MLRVRPASVWRGAVSGQRVLVVDDEPQIRRSLRVALRANGYEVEEAATGEAALEQAAARLPELIILDLSLPGVDGVEVCRRLREWTQVPVIILSVHGDDEAKVRALDEGADDYVTKPFSPRELLARVRAALRHTARTPEVQIVSFDGITADFKKMEIKRDGIPVVLTAQEFKTFQFLVQNADRVISRDELLNEVWGYQNYPSTRTVDNHILKLRQKLERDPSSPVHFRTVHGMGYKFVR
jgi:DNA-binding response OmpR family regulator